jgi:septal ring factor EnvC (AmiA/AmiB activator)
LANGLASEPTTTALPPAQDVESVLETSRSEALSFVSTQSSQLSLSHVNGEKKKSGFKALYKKLRPGGSKTKEPDSTAELDTLRLELSEVAEREQKIERELNETTLQREQLQLERDQMEQEKQTLRYNLDVATSRWGRAGAAAASAAAARRQARSRRSCMTRSSAATPRAPPRRALPPLRAAQAPPPRPPPTPRPQAGDGGGGGGPAAHRQQGDQRHADGAAARGAALR